MILSSLLIAAHVLAQTISGPVTISGPSTVGGTAAASPYTCGEPTSSGATLQASVQNIQLFTPCTTGTDASGFTLSHLYVYVGTSSGKLYAAIYNDTTSGCDGQAHCPSTPLCSDTTGITPTGSAFNEDTPTGCGVFPASTSFWIAFVPDNNTLQVGYQASNCPAPLAFTSTSQYNVGATAGVWPNVTGDTGTGGGCYVAYMVLTPQ